MNELMNKIDGTRVIIIEKKYILKVLLKQRPTKHRYMYVSQLNKICLFPLRTNIAAE